MTVEDGKYAEEGEEHWQDSNVSSSFDVIFDAPINFGDGLAEGVDGGRNPLPDEHIEVAMVSRVSENVWDKKGEQVSRRVAPGSDLLQRGRADSEVVAQYGEEGDELHGAEGESKNDHDEEVDGRAGDLNRKGAKDAKILV